MLLRYYKRKDAAKKFLGGKCVDCGSVENLQFDHKDRKTKEFTIAQLWSVSEKRFWEEVKKCQLLCQKCHIKKTLEDLGQKSAKDTHGTISSYRYCRCPVCKKWHSEYSKKYWTTHKRIWKDGKRITVKMSS